MEPAYKQSDEELGRSIREAASACVTDAELGERVRDMFWSEQISGEVAEKQRMFARYMKDAWGAKEGESVFVHAMVVLGRFKRHENMLRDLVAGRTHADDVPVLAACELLRGRQADLEVVVAKE